MWGCHFLILSSNALWRKFVKLDQWRLKLVYKGVKWRKEEEECRTPKASEMPSISPTGWYSFPPLLFFRVVASAVRCHVFWHFALERMQEKVVWGGRYEGGNVRRKQKRLFLLLSKLVQGQGLFFFFPQGVVLTSRQLTVGAPQSKDVFMHFHYLAWDVHCPGMSFIFSKHRCLRVAGMHHSATWSGAVKSHLHSQKNCWPNVAFATRLD